MVALNQAVRKVPVQYAQRMVGRKVYGGQSTYLPLKVNYAGVMPVIFAGAILAFPQMVLNPLAANFPTVAFLADWGNALGQPTLVHYLVLSLLIFGFSYFWISIMFKPVQIADDLKKNNGYVVGVRPGEPTAQFLDFVMTRLTLAGSLFLLLIALTPDILMFQLGFPGRLASFLGGTGGLITVGVALDTMRQVETYLLQSHYDGFLKKGRVGGVATPVPPRRVPSGESGEGLGSLGTACLAIFLLGIAAWVWGHWADLAR
jgi:preprotein translocase subunit SecY